MKRKYEAMFMFDPAAAIDWDKIKAEVDRLMERAEAKVLLCGKWDERRLAYEIHGIKRAIYVLTYFEIEPSMISVLERDAGLSESVIRSLFVRADHVTEEQMKEALAAGGMAPAPEAGSRFSRDEGGQDWSERRPAREPVVAAPDVVPERIDVG